VVDRQTSPDDPSPSLQPHYRAFTATTRRSAPVPRTGTQPLAVPAAWDSPVHDPPQATTAPPAGSPCRGDRFPRSMQEPRPRSRHLHAGHRLTNQQAPARLIPGLQSIPGFDVNLFLRHVISGSLTLAFVIHTCRTQRHDFPPTLTTTALDRSSSRRFAASACTAAAEGHRPTTPAPPSPAQHRIQNLGLLHPASFNVRGTPSDEDQVGGAVRRALPPRLAQPSVCRASVAALEGRPI
jgi:hypothetical protein